MGILNIKDKDVGKDVTWKTSPTSNHYRTAPLVSKRYGRKAGVVVRWAERDTFIPERLIVKRPD